VLQSVGAIPVDAGPARLVVVFVHASLTQTHKGAQIAISDCPNLGK